MLNKVFSNTALGHFLAHVVVVFVMAGVAAVLRDGSLAANLVGLGLPIALVNVVVNLLRSNVPNL